MSSNLLWCSCKPPQKAWCSRKVSGTRSLFLVPTRNPKTVNLLKKWSWKSEVHLKKVLCKGYLWREAKTFPGEKRKHYQPTYNGKFSVGMHKHSKRWRSTLPKKTGITKFQKIDNDHRQKNYCRKKDKKNGQNICTKKTLTYIGEKKGGLSNKKVSEGLTLKHANKKFNGE